MAKDSFKSLRRYEGQNHARLLNFACFHNQPFLSSDRTRAWTCEAIARARELHAFELWAFVIMPTHVHLLIWPKTPVPPILTSIKQSVANRAVHYARKHRPETLTRTADEDRSGKVTYRFWQRGGGYDRNLWTPSHIFSAINYIHMNPVRADLCDRPEQWTWSSAAQYLVPRNTTQDSQWPLRIDVEHLPANPR